LSEYAKGYQAHIIIRLHITIIVVEIWNLTRGSNPDRRGERPVLYRSATKSYLRLEDKANNGILESNFAAKRQRQFLRNFLSVEKEPKNKNGTHQRLLREGVKNDVSDKIKMSNVFK
jgi:hypothetical protein